MEDLTAIEKIISGLKDAFENTGHILHVGNPHYIKDKVGYKSSVPVVLTDNCFDRDSKSLILRDVFMIHAANKAKNLMGRMLGIEPNFNTAVEVSNRGKSKCFPYNSLLYREDDKANAASENKSRIHDIAEYMISELHNNIGEGNIEPKTPDPS